MGTEESGLKKWAGEAEERGLGDAKENGLIGDFERERKKKSQEYRRKWAVKSGRVAEVSGLNIGFEIEKKDLGYKKRLG